MAFEGLKRRYGKVTYTKPKRSVQGVINRATGGRPGGQSMMGQRKNPSGYKIPKTPRVSGRGWGP